MERFNRTKKWKVIYLWADILDFLHYILMYEDIESFKWQIDYNKFTEFFLKNLPNPWILKVDLEDFKKYFIKYIFKSLSDLNSNVKDFSEKLEDRTNEKLVLVDKSEELKEYIKNYNPLI